MIDSRLALMQLSDSFFPSGSFTLSHGLEAMVQTNQIRDPQDIEAFLYLLLYNKVGCSDLIALIHTYRASTNNDLMEVRRADEYLYAQTLIQTTREAQQRSGQALLLVARSRSLCLDDMWSGTPAIDIAQMSHHRLTSKQFST